MGELRACAELAEHEAQLQERIKAVMERNQELEAQLQSRRTV